MQIIYRSTEGDRELDVALRNPDATLGDLVRAARGRPVESVLVNDRVVPASCLISDSGLHDGAYLVVPPAPPYRAGASALPSLELVVVAGPSAGLAFPLRSGRSSIGRHSANTVVLTHTSVSRRHCDLDVDPDGRARIVDCDATNRTVVNGVMVPSRESIELAPGAVVEIGAFAVMVRFSTNDDRPRGGDVSRHTGHTGTMTFNRPPRTAVAPSSGRLVVPTEPSEATRPDFNLTTIFGPLVLAAVLIGVTRDLRFALFALLSPILALGMWAESRRRVTKKNREAQTKYRSELRELRREIEAANATDTARLWARCPDPAEVLRRAALPSIRLWERRRRHNDFLSLFVGIADIEWRPQLQGASATLTPRVAELPEACFLRSAPATAELANGGVVGVVGNRASALALARSLVCQAAVHHGPADLTIGVVVDVGRGPEWDWAKWLPHTQNTGGAAGARWLGEGRDQCDELLEQMGDGAGAETILSVIDSDTFTEGKDAPARTLLRNDRHAYAGPNPPPARVSGIVIASTADRLPAMCNTVIEMRNGDARAVIRLPDEGREIDDVLSAGLTVAQARSCARNLARFEDPELHLPGGDLPDLVRLLPLLGLPTVDAESVRKKWRGGRPAAHPVAPLGVTDKGVFTLDLVDDGPHGLVGGMTGSGKSEMLRTLVASLATGTDPRHLTFVLIDYKGGAAFDECSRLPHTVGMVTDLDDQLSERALQALNAELHYRERQLRDTGADNIQDYLKLGRAEPMPRLVVVVDEFATLAKELPEFMTSLVGIAQRGRSLGVHMILATQRPSGVVNDDIRANTSLKVALRVEDAADSIDVINVRDAAEINRSRKGRAYVRLGPSELIPIQTAMINCVTEEDTDIPVAVTAFTFGPAQEQPADPVVPDGQGGPPDPNASPTDLARLVDVIIEATALEEIPAPRRPWPEPLPPRIALGELLGASESGDRPVAVVAQADDPRRQTQYPVGWDVGEGNLSLFGIPGSGTTTTLASIALSLAFVHSPDEFEFQVFDFGVGDLAALEPLPHTGTVVLAGDRERQMRLMRHLIAELGRRRLGGAAARSRRVVVLVDNFAAMRAAYTDVEGLELMEQLARVVADGQSVGISFAMSADRLNTVPGAFSAPQQWLFRLADAYDYVSAGVDRKNLPAKTAGRAVVAQTGLHIQVGIPTPSLADAVAEIAGRLPDAQRVATTIGVLPREVSLADLDAAAELSGDLWIIPIGMAESNLSVAALQLYEGEHALIAGPARSGKSTTLWTLAEALRRGATPVHIVGMGGRRSPLRDCPVLDRFAGTTGEAAAMLAKLRTVSGSVVLLIDDAETFDDTDGAIGTLLAAEMPGLHVVGAGNNDSLRTLYSHWTKTVRRSKAGVLLRPNIDMDGDLLGATLPRRAPVQMTVGRGYLVSNGEPRIVQSARP